MSRVLIASTIAASVAATNVHDRKFYEGKFFEWLQDFKETVQVRDGEHFVHMLQNFANNHDLIEQVNSQNLTYTLGHNAFSHMSHEEWVEYMRFGLAKDREHEDSDLIHEAAENEVLASSIDWVSKGAVTGVKDQGNCGSCWSFSATGALEGVYKIKTGTLKSYSEQELVSCNNSPRTNHGCNGGLMDYAFQWVKDNGGLCTESAYPYTSGTTGQDGTCNSHTSCDDKTLKLTGYVDVKKNDDAALASAVSLNPTAVAIQANDPAFQLYKSGVLTGACGANLNHGVLAVGFGTDSVGGDYWKIKNSWGTSWGEGGYIRIARGSSYNNGKGQCGVYSGPPSYPKM